MFTNLLITKTLEGYPRDFVLARIRGRGCCAPGSTAGRAATRKDLDREYLWVFGLLDRKTAEILGPFFSLFEVERLVTCLRLGRGHESARIPEALADSLLSEPLRKLLVSQNDFADKIDEVLDVMNLGPVIGTRMEELLAGESWTDLEACLLETYLRFAARSSRRQWLKAFFRSLIDIRNLLALHKAMRWKSEKAPPFLEGGALPERMFKSFFHGKSLESLEEFARRRFAGRSVLNLEDNLIHGLAVQLHRQGRCEGGLRMLLSHLWNLYAGLREEAGEIRGYEGVA